MTNNTFVLGQPGNGKGFIDLNRQKLPDPNAFILGTAGYGVGHFTRKEILSAYYGSEKNRIVIIDAFGDYCKWAKDLGGEVINITAVSNIHATADSRVICFNLGSMEFEMIQIGIITVMDYIWHVMRPDCKTGAHCYVYIDDAELLFRDDVCANCIKDFYKRARPYGFVLTLVSRTPGTILNSDIGISLLSLTECVVVLSLSMVNADRVTELFGLTDKQRQKIEKAGQGEGLILKGEKVITIEDFSVKSCQTRRFA